MPTHCFLLHIAAAAVVLLLLLWCRVEPEELDAMVQAVPKKVTIVGKMEGRWEVSNALLLLLPWLLLHCVEQPQLHCGSCMGRDSSM
jgi:hypothetical protein